MTRLTTREPQAQQSPGGTAFGRTFSEHLVSMRWSPAREGLGLYLRPLMFARDESLALRPADEYEFLVMAFVTEGFFGAGRAIKVWVDERFSRAAPLGTGAAKYAGNYAAAYQADQEAAKNGCDQVAWLDAVERAGSRSWAP
jgi:branched-chain amino acid aminotransferase